MYRRKRDRKEEEMNDCLSLVILEDINKQEYVRFVCVCVSWQSWAKIEVGEIKIVMT